MVGLNATTGSTMGKEVLFDFPDKRMYVYDLTTLNCTMSEKI